jgi:type III secretion protein T
MSGGGFLLFAGMVLESFVAWPLDSTTWVPRMSGLAVFAQSMNGMMSTVLLVAAPVLVISFAIDLALGLIGRHAPQLNVSPLSSALKGLASTAVWLLALHTLGEGFGNALARRVATMLPQLMRSLSS